MPKFKNNNADDGEWLQIFNFNIKLLGPSKNMTREFRIDFSWCN